MNKSDLLQMLSRFAHQRPGLDFANYGDVSLYRAEARRITRDLHDVQSLLRAISWRDSVTLEHLVGALTESRRLQLRGDELEYCTGQYWPVEYRPAVARALAEALWSAWRDNLPPSSELERRRLSAGEWLRTTARRELGARLARRYFN
jgi:hypothetical protein